MKLTGTGDFPVVEMSDLSFPDDGKWASVKRDVRTYYFYPDGSVEEKGWDGNLGPGPMGTTTWNFRQYTRPVGRLDDRSTKALSAKLESNARKYEEDSDKWRRRDKTQREALKAFNNSCFVKGCAILLVPFGVACIAMVIWITAIVH